MDIIYQTWLQDQTTLTYADAKYMRPQKLHQSTRKGKVESALCPTAPQYGWLAKACVPVTVDDPRSVFLVQVVYLGLLLRGKNVLALK